ncbi:unnamed protein product [Thelazia callipaeda]|uniref:Serine/threonine-protein kinase DDB_G0282963 n=1 Tax=Thelazia callipaeda TaxID=103827 RepID=A0A0N5CXV7_THECL|nr:unnamed protein product [Thelazia callipaeda]
MQAVPKSQDSEVEKLSDRNRKHSQRKKFIQQLSESKICKYMECMQSNNKYKNQIGFSSMHNCAQCNMEVITECTVNKNNDLIIHTNACDDKSDVHNTTTIKKALAPSPICKNTLDSELTTTNPFFNYNYNQINDDNNGADLAKCVHCGSRNVSLVLHDFNGQAMNRSSANLSSHKESYDSNVILENSASKYHNNEDQCKKDHQPGTRENYVHRHCQCSDCIQNYSAKSEGNTKQEEKSDTDSFFDEMDSISETSSIPSARIQRAPHNLNLNLEKQEISSNKMSNQSSKLETIAMSDDMRTSFEKCDSNIMSQGSQISLFTAIKESKSFTERILKTPRVTESENTTTDESEFSLLTAKQGSLAQISASELNQLSTAQAISELSLSSDKTALGDHCTLRAESVIMPSEMSASTIKRVKSLPDSKSTWAAKFSTCMDSNAPMRTEFFNCNNYSSEIKNMIAHKLLQWFNNPAREHLSDNYEELNHSKNSVLKTASEENENDISSIKTAKSISGADNEQISSDKQVMIKIGNEDEGEHAQNITVKCELNISIRIRQNEFLSSPEFILQKLAVDGINVYDMTNEQT